MTLEPHHVKEPLSPCSGEVVAAVVLLRDDGAALLQHRDDKAGLRGAGTWVPPGGHCKPGESIEACARREFHEETGYQCNKLNWMISLEDDYDEGWPVYQLEVFWARYDGVQSVRCLEGQDLQFVERHLASSYPIPSYLIEVWDLAIAASEDHSTSR